MFTTMPTDTADIEIRADDDGRLLARIESPPYPLTGNSLWWVKFVCVDAMDRGFKSIKAAEYYVLSMHIEDGTDRLESAAYLPEDVSVFYGVTQRRI